MTTVTEKQLIDSLKSLKNIKPRQEWAVLLKSQIMAEKKIEVVSQSTRFADFVSNFKFQISNSFSRRLAYSLATILILVTGVFGLARLLPNEIASHKSTAALTVKTSPQSEAKQKVVASLNVKIKDLTKVLRSNPDQDSETIKNIIVNLKTLADIPGTDLIGNKDFDTDLQDLYGAIVVSQITDLQKTTLTNDQQKIISKAMELYNDGKYGEALEELLLINK
ncbi:MAG: hypothetical protein NTV36_02515 [Candidatus Staskawiczbacteria bacterium]|nr:hypothetical protein [Candidatus Staskawiczbacteria bacterium]